MAQDPASVFGGLMGFCISDEYSEDKGRVARDGVLFLLLGVCSSIATAYFLSLAGFLL